MRHIQGQRYIVFERFLDNLELYLDNKEVFRRKAKALADAGKYADIDDLLEAEKDTLETLRELTRRSLDEYVNSMPRDSEV